MKKILKDTFISCIPISPGNRPELWRQLEEALKHKPDFIEWRRDFFEDLSLEEEKNILMKIKSIRGETGLIYTFRNVNEGGDHFVKENDRLPYILGCMDCQGADYIDIEVKSSDAFKNEVRKNKKEDQCGLIFSSHYFDWVPSNKEIDSVLEVMNNEKADVLKLAMMPENEADVRRCLSHMIEKDQIFEKLMWSHIGITSPV